MLLTHQSRQTLQNKLTHQTLSHRRSLLGRPTHHFFHQAHHRTRSVLQLFTQRHLRRLTHPIRKIELLASVTLLQEMLRRRPQSRKQHLHLLLLSPRRKQRSPRINLVNQTPQTPHIYLTVIRLHQHYLRRTVVPTLNVGKLLLIGETSRPEVYQLDPRLPHLLEHHVLRLYITMDDIFLDQTRSTLCKNNKACIN